MNKAPFRDCARKTALKRPMTIGIGFVGANNSAVLASDSEMTWPGYKVPGYEKIVRIAFPEDHFAGLVKSGDWDWANIFHETLEEVARTWPIKDELSIRNACEAALVKAQRKIIEARPRSEDSPLSAAEWIQSRSHGFLVAYVYGEKTFFYTADLVGAVPTRCFHNFAAIGSGSDLATYLLTNIDTASLDLDDAIGAAAYVIDSCIKHSQGCGPPMQFMQINKIGRWTKVMPSVTDYFREAVVRVNAEHFRSLPSRIGGAVKPPKNEK